MIPKRIICIGASSVQGRVDPEGGGFAGRLRKWHETNARHNAVFNLGIGGNTTEDLLKRLEPECSIRKPDLIIFKLGLNDSRRIDRRDGPNNVDLNQFQRNIERLIEVGQKMAKVMFIGNYPIDDSKTGPIPWAPKYFYLLEDAEKYTQASQKVILEKGLPYLDLWSDWIKRNYKEWLYEDGLHANSEGHQEIFERLKDLLEKQYS